MTDYSTRPRTSLTSYHYTEVLTPLALEKDDSALRLALMTAANCRSEDAGNSLRK